MSGPAILILLLLYFLPTVVAYWRGSNNIVGVGLVNLLAGWTIIGWVAALVMACWAKPPAPTA